MKSLIPALGPEGLALFLTTLLIVGTKETKTGKFKPLGWWWVLGLSLIAGASFVAAGWPFDIIPKLVMGDLVGAIAAVKPGLSLPAIALSLMAVLLWVGVSRRQVAVIGIVLFYLMAGSDGGLGIFSEKIKASAEHFAS